jgi:hypothetical protein
MSEPTVFRGPGDGRLNLRSVRIPSEARPALFVVVDTEEEFEWGSPFSRANTSVGAMRHLGLAHSVLQRYGVRPTYVIDYPIASRLEAHERLIEYVRAGECTIGAHLHPWVNPPFVETLSNRHSYACNLPGHIEVEKLRELTLIIEQNLGVRPQVYKAGRYGFGPSTVSALETLGYAIDVSVQPASDFSLDGGPSFAAFRSTPFWFGSRQSLLEIPCTTGYTGVARRVASPLHAVAKRLAALKVPAILERSGVFDRLGLSPEGFTTAEHKRLTKTLLADGVRTFTMTFHSPSLEPGHTPYVRTSRDRDALLGRIDAYCQFFFGELGGTAPTPTEFAASLELSHSVARRMAAMRCAS